MAPKHPKHTVDTAKTKAALDSAKKAKLMEDALQKDLEKIGATPDSISDDTSLKYVVSVRGI
jgi:hypothetical protein